MRRGRSVLREVGDGSDGLNGSEGQARGSLLDGTKVGTVNAAAFV